MQRSRAPFSARQHTAHATALLPTLLLLALALLVTALLVPSAAAADEPAGANSDDAPSLDDAETARELPEFTVWDARRLRHSSSDWVGEPLLVDFWATWCGPCNFTLPELQSIHEDYEDRGLRLIGISLDTGAGGGVRAENWAEERNVTYEIVHDTSGEARRALAVTNIPVLFLVDAEGRIVADWWGEPDFDEVRARIDEIVPAADEGKEADDGDEADKDAD